MLKDHETDGNLQTGQSRSSDDRARGGGRVYCFVGTAELRRLLSLLAGTELLVELVRDVVRSTPEPELPPALL